MEGKGLLQCGPKDCCEYGGPSLSPREDAVKGQERYTFISPSNASLALLSSTVLGILQILTQGVLVITV